MCKLSNLLLQFYYSLKLLYGKNKCVSDKQSNIIKLGKFIIIRVIERHCSSHYFIVRCTVVQYTHKLVNYILQFHTQLICSSIHVQCI